MDSTCPRAFAVLQPLKVTITNWNEGNDDDVLEDFEVDRHPKSDRYGYTNRSVRKDNVSLSAATFLILEGPKVKRRVARFPKDSSDLLPNGSVRLRYAYVIECEEIVRDPETQNRSN